MKQLKKKKLYLFPISQRRAVVKNMSPSVYS